MSFVNPNIQSKSGFGPDFEPRYVDPMGRYGVQVAYVKHESGVEKPRLEPNVADWDKTLFARDIAQQAMLRAGFNPVES